MYNSQIIKDKIKNIAKGDSYMSLVLLRLFFMENFLKRISYSKYRNIFILKGGMLVSQELGLNSRVTKDIDVTIRNCDLSIQSVSNMVNELINMEMADGISYIVKDIYEIMDEREYPGVRVSLIGRINNTNQQFQIDISTNDAITPAEIEYEYRQIFDDSKIKILSYNLETLLSEKMETILDRNITNTRMRDFYDVYMIYSIKKDDIDFDALKDALFATMKRRNTSYLALKTKEYLELMKEDNYLIQNWKVYRENNSYVGDLDYDTVLSTIQKIVKRIGYIE